MIRRIIDKENNRQLQSYFEYLLKCKFPKNITSLEAELLVFTPRTVTVAKYYYRQLQEVICICDEETILGTVLPVAL